VQAAILSPPAPFDAVFMQRALLEILLLSVPAGLLGSWIVLRRLAFFTHGVGTAAFPGLVVAGPLGVAAPLAAMATAIFYSFGLDRLARRRGIGSDAATGLLLVAALAVGVVLASDVFESGAGVDRLLFGSLIGLADSDLWLTAAAAIAVLALDRALGRSWLAEGFDPGGGRRLGLSTALADTLLLVAIALSAVVALTAVGALLVTAVFVIPAATVRLLAPSLAILRVGAVALAAVEGVAALWLAYVLNVGPGPALAVLGGAVFGLVAVGTAARTRLTAAAALRAGPA
jgi:ABC-type Mn2+/Zn2+ transport system permease subunit